MFDANLVRKALFKLARQRAIAKPSRLQRLAQGFVFCFVVPGFKKLNCIRQCGLRLYAYEGSEPLAVSYTHLTLPTIYSV